MKLNIEKIKVFFTIVAKSFLNGILNLIRCIFWSYRKSDHPKKVCVHRVGQIGDLICALPAMANVRQIAAGAASAIVARLLGDTPDGAAVNSAVDAAIQK